MASTLKRISLLEEVGDNLPLLPKVMKKFDKVSAFISVPKV